VNAAIYITFERMDGSEITSINLVIDKNFTGVGIQKATDALGEVNQPGKFCWRSVPIV
jgi:uncharacterized protein GlcG (DUF336 family)